LGVLDGLLVATGRGTLPVPVTPVVRRILTADVHHDHREVAIHDALAPDVALAPLDPLQAQEAVAVMSGLRGRIRQPATAHKTSGVVSHPAVGPGPTAGTPI